MLKPTIEHPRFGTLSFEGGYRWEGKIALPGFRRHGWREALKIEIYVKEKAPPDPRAFALLEAVVANASKLPDLIVDALWNELSGRETENGVWWSRPGVLDEVNEGLRRADHR